MNARIVRDSKNEQAHESRDCVWHRWEGFCDQIGLSDQPLLHLLSNKEKELCLWSFLSLYRVADWEHDGRLKGQREKPVVATTVRDAASSLALSFRDNLEQSPLHQQDSTFLLPTIKAS